MTFTSKADADAYDKMLDMADELFILIADSDLVEDEAKREELSLYLAQNKEEVLYALGAKRRPSSKKNKEPKAETAAPTSEHEKQQPHAEPDQDQNNATIEAA